jgi:hypothetical protein
MASSSDQYPFLKNGVWFPLLFFLNKSGLENMMYAAGIFTVVGDDGERAIQVEPGNAYIELRLRRAGVNEIYLGIAAVTFTVTAER